MKQKRILARMKKMNLTTKRRRKIQLKIYVSMKRLNFIARFAINAIMEK
jgi:hypothetical protein